MRRRCIACDRPIILGRNAAAPIVMDAAPSASGRAVLFGDLNDQPTVIFGIETVSDAEWYGVPLTADRYDRHECGTGG